MQVLQQIKIVDKKEKKSNSFQVIILSLKANKNSFDGKILGRKLCDWVAYACNRLQRKIIDFDMKQNILEFIKNEIDKKFDYTLVLLSSTPLLEQKTIEDIMEYSSFKNVNLCKLPVGYVLNNKYFLNTENPQIDSLYSQNLEDFYLVENKKQYSYALDILQTRINDFHVNNGVEIVSPKSTYIEPDVDIEKGVTIYPNNVIKGNSHISKDVILKENNVIENSKIGNNSCISGSVITDSVISSNVYIASFNEIKNSLIGMDTIIEKGCTIKNYSIDINSKIRPNSVLGEANDSDNRTR